jgi:hypothetical protein
MIAAADFGDQMDIRNVAKNGTVEPGSGRPKRADAKPVVLIPQPPRDEARISSDSQKTAAAITNLAERARSMPAERADVVANARAKLLGGELDTDVVNSATAKRLLEAKFFSG